MAWTTIMESDSLEGFAEATPAVEDLPAGTTFRIVVDTYVPIAPLLDIPWLSEWLAEQLLGYDAEVLEVYNVGWYELVIKMKALGVDPVTIAGLIIGGLLALSLFILSIRMDADWRPFADLATIVKWGAIGAVGVLGIKLLSDVSRRRA